MGKWFLDFSFWTRGYRTVQTAHCALSTPRGPSDLSQLVPWWFTHCGTHHTDRGWKKVTEVALELEFWRGSQTVDPAASYMSQWYHAMVTMVANRNRGRG